MKREASPINLMREVGFSEMPDCTRLLERAKRNPNGVRFTEACQLAECYGFILVRQQGSHHIYSLPGYHKLVNLQEDGNMAKSYQIRQLLRIIEDLAVTNDNADDEGQDDA